MRFYMWNGMTLEIPKWVPVDANWYYPADDSLGGVAFKVVPEEADCYQWGGNGWVHAVDKWEHLRDSVRIERPEFEKRIKLKEPFVPNKTKADVYFDCSGAQVPEGIVESGNYHADSAVAGKSLCGLPSEYLYCASPPHLGVSCKDCLKLIGLQEIEPVGEISFAEYQRKVQETSINTVIHGNSWVYPLMGIADEAGEVLGKAKKVFRDSGGILDDEKRFAIMDELSDVQWYLAEACTQLGFPLEEVVLHNLRKLKDRSERGVIGGSGDNR